MSTLPNYTPFYGGGQVANPANVILSSGAPNSSLLSENRVGTVAVDNANANVYALASKSGGVDTWFLLGGNSAGLNGLAADSGSASPSGNSINLFGTANQIDTSGSGSTITFALDSSLIAPGSITATTSIASALGDITAYNGNVVLSTVGNKLQIQANSTQGSVGTFTLGGGATTIVPNSAVTASSLIYLQVGALGTVTVPSALAVISQIAATSFTVKPSDASDTSVVSFLIIN
jgi:hypothetical protein